MKLGNFLLQTVGIVGISIEETRAARPQREMLVPSKLCEERGPELRRGGEGQKIIGREIDGSLSGLPPAVERWNLTFSIQVLPKADLPSWRLAWENPFTVETPPPSQ